MNVDYQKWWTIVLLGMSLLNTHSNPPVAVRFLRLSCSEDSGYNRHHHQTVLCISLRL